MREAFFNLSPSSCPFAASRMGSSHAAPQVCRPHFHAPIPWLGDPKMTPSGSPWGSSFVCPQDPQDKVSQIQSSSGGGGGGGGGSGGGHQSGQHLFSFPPTPPKDSTPDSVQTGPTEYQVSLVLEIKLNLLFTIPPSCSLSHPLRRQLTRLCTKLRPRKLPQFLRPRIAGWT